MEGREKHDPLCFANEENAGHALRFKTVSLLLVIREKAILFQVLRKANCWAHVQLQPAVRRGAFSEIYLFW